MVLVRKPLTPLSAVLMTVGMRPVGPEDSRPPRQQAVLLPVPVRQEAARAEAQAAARAVARKAARKALQAVLMVQLVAIAVARPVVWLVV